MPRRAQGAAVAVGRRWDGGGGGRGARRRHGDGVATPRRWLAYARELVADPSRPIAASSRPRPAPRRRRGGGGGRYLLRLPVPCMLLFAHGPGRSEYPRMRPPPPPLRTAACALASLSAGGGSEACGGRGPCGISACRLRGAGRLNGGAAEERRPRAVAWGAAGDKAPGMSALEEGTFSGSASSASLAVAAAIAADRCRPAVALGAERPACSAGAVRSMRRVASCGASVKVQDGDCFCSAQQMLTIHCVPIRAAGMRSEGLSHEGDDSPIDGKRTDRVPLAPNVTSTRTWAVT